MNIATPIQSSHAQRSESHAIETIDCPLCGGADFAEILRATDPHQPAGEIFAVVRCRRCDFVLTNPRPTREEIGRFYPDDYAPHAGRTEKRPSLRSWIPLAAMERVTGRLLLDVGCGSGRFLAAMREHGWNVCGLDNSLAAVEVGRREYGLNIHCGQLPCPELTDTYDVITMWHVLEHLHDPIEILREVHNFLNDNGRLFIAVPTVDSWAFRHFGHHWYGLELPRHLSHFTPKSLAKTLEHAGWKIEALRRSRHPDWLRSSAQLALRNSGGGWLSRAMRSKRFAGLVSHVVHLFGRSDCLIVEAKK